ncbi:hypothetical protein CAC42_3377 [Sphaceloma murrayae]|uniref:Uncharacterized protein n=1 Tax=Sphaceloma murrayae TaxID=2082308 RepID=A0A2K1R1B8_9PEZI|nr:hypothetical protein CAC42_3377 [Sphaceloma murrayae]
MVTRHKELLLKIRLWTFPLGISNITRNGQNLHAAIDDEKRPKGDIAQDKADWKRFVYDLPRAFYHAITDRERQAILSAHWDAHCIKIAIVILTPFLNALDPTAKYRLQVATYTPNTPPMTTQIGTRSSPANSTLFTLQLELRSQAFAINLTGAQIGWNNTLVPWDTFVQGCSRVSRFFAPESILAYWETSMKRMDLEMPEVERDLFWIDWVEEFASRLGDGMQTWYLIPDNIFDYEVMRHANRRVGFINYLIRLIDKTGDVSLNVIHELHGQKAALEASSRPRAIPIRRDILRRRING